MQSSLKANTQSANDESPQQFSNCGKIIQCECMQNFRRGMLAKIASLQTIDRKALKFGLNVSMAVSPQALHIYT
jgi:hypothetical protein